MIRSGPPRTTRFPLFHLRPFVQGLSFRYQCRARASFDPSHRLKGGDLQPMSEISFETALGDRVEDMLDACTRCGKCVEVCPSVTPAGIAGAASSEIISGILDIVRTGEGPEASAKWAAACM